MTPIDLLQWGKSRSYPRMVLDSQKRDILRAGQSSWEQLLQEHDIDRLVRLQERIILWEQYEKKGA